MMCLNGKALGLVLLVAASASATEIRTIDFRVDGDQSVVELIADGPLSVTQSENTANNQVILDVVGAKLGAGAKRKLDTSSFNSPVILVSPYAAGSDAKIVVQMRSAGSAVLSQKGNKASLTVAAGEAGAQTTASAPADPLGPEAVEAAPPVTRAESAVTTASPEPTPPAAPVGVAAFDEAQKTRRFTGSPITIQVRDAELKDVFRLIGEASGFNIVLDPEVNGKITVSLIDVPWDQALDVVLSTSKLGAERSHNILRVMTLKNMTAEKKAQLEAKQAAESVAPKVTRIFAINYASPDDLVKTLKDMGKTTIGDKLAEPTIVVDKRTNSIIVQDTQDNVERMAKLIEMLDTQTPQIMIEARVVEAKETFSRALNGALGIGGSDGIAVAGNINPINALVGSPGVFSDGAAVASAAKNGVLFGGSIPLMGSSPRINAFLNASENEGTARIVTSPKAVILNREKATISQTFPTVLPVITQSSAGNQTTYNVVEGKIEMTVEGNVTNDEGVLLNLVLSRDVPETADAVTTVAKRSISTKVLVENGSTLVMGGIYTTQDTTTEGGVPFLRKIPIIGALFGSNTKNVDRREIFFFITPRILNRTKAGFGQ